MVSLTDAQKAYRFYAPAYDVLFGPFLERARRQGIRYANDKPGQKILEIGIGTGLSLPYYRKDVRLTGIDVSREMLAKATSRASRMDFVSDCRFSVMNAENTDFADDSFDVIVALFVASAVQSLPRFGAELRRLCRPGGRIVVVNRFSSPRKRFRSVSGYLGRYSGTLGFEPWFPLDEFLDQTGLPVTEIIRLGAFRGLHMLNASKC